MKELVVRMQEGHIKILTCTDSDEEMVKISEAVVKVRWDWRVLADLGWQRAKLLGRSVPDGYQMFYKGETPDELLEIALANHDWWYQMSDDFGVWGAGEKSLARIQFFMTQVSTERARELWNMYAPVEMQKE